MDVISICRKSGIVFVASVCIQIQSAPIETCEKPKSADEILNCVERVSPEALAQILETEQAGHDVDRAGTWQNPDIDLSYSKGSPNKDDELEIGINQKIELGGKLSSRKGFAKAVKESAEAKLKLTTLELKKEILLRLHRLRQLTSETEFVRETKRTFGDLIKQYSRRSALSPDQKVSFSLFKLAESGAMLKQQSLKDELLEIEGFLRRTVGLGVADVNSNLPRSPSKWPPLIEDQNKNLRIDMANADREKASAEMHSIKAESWPDLTVGLFTREEKTANDNNRIYGVKLNLPLPLWNLNRAGRASAVAGLKAAEYRYENEKRAADENTDKLRTYYLSSVETLKSYPKTSELQSQHDELEKQFMKGLIPTVTLVDAHEKLLEVEQSKNERELKALDAFYTLNLLSGQKVEVLQ